MAIENLPDVKGYATADLFIKHPTKNLWKMSVCSACWISTCPLTRLAHLTALAEQTMSLPLLLGRKQYLHQWRGSSPLAHYFRARSCLDEGEIRLAFWSNHVASMLSTCWMTMLSLHLGTKSGSSFKVSPSVGRRLSES